MNLDNITSNVRERILLGWALNKAQGKPIDKDTDNLVEQEFINPLLHCSLHSSVVIELYAMETQLRELEQKYRLLKAAESFIIEKINGLKEKEVGDMGEE